MGRKKKVTIKAEPEQEQEEAENIEAAEEPAKEEDEEGYLDGMAPKKIPAVHNAALKYVEKTAVYSSAGKEVANAKAVLMDRMTQAGRKQYRFGALEVLVTQKEGVKVIVPKPQE